MASVQETPSYDAGIYQIETTDPVLGGHNGIANAQAKGLANRTAFLKQQIDQLNSGQLTPSWISSKDYVQGELQKLDTKQSVRAATTDNITLSGVQTIDGVVLTVGDRVLVKDQTTAAQNGIYLVAAQSWTRATDADNGTKLSSGSRIAVEVGAINAGKVWYLANSGEINLGSTNLVFYDEHQQATESLKGIARFATQAEVDSRSQNLACVYPSQLRELGVGQSWQDLTSSRALNTTYTNTTGRPIAVCIGSTSGTTSSSYLVVTPDGGAQSVQLPISQGQVGGGVFKEVSFAIVPPGAKYLASASALEKWVELR